MEKNKSSRRRALSLKVDYRVSLQVWHIPKLLSIVQYILSLT